MTQKAIAVAVRKATAADDPAASKFFGDPVIPAEWTQTFDEDEIFFCQLRLADLAARFPQSPLPFEGFLYLFLHTADGPYRLRPDVRYYDGEPTVVFEDFNAAVDGYERLTHAWQMAFSVTDAVADGTRLFGEPSDWSYADESRKLLLQFDPLDSGMGFLDHLDGYVYLFFGEDDRALSDITLHTEHS